MTQVQIDDFNCEICKKITMANLDIKTGKYNCLVCGFDNLIKIIKKNNEILDVLEDREKTEIEKLQEKNEKLREEITKMIIKQKTKPKPNSKIWLKINELVENEIQ